MNFTMQILKSLLHQAQNCERIDHGQNELCLGSPASLALLVQIPTNNLEVRQNHLHVPPSFTKFGETSDACLRRENASKMRYADIATRGQRIMH